MARMKFLCDAERCIECNACVTACKQEHDIPWGVNLPPVVTLNDGLPSAPSFSVACMTYSTAPSMSACPHDVSASTETDLCLHAQALSAHRGRSSPPR